MRSIDTLNDSYPIGNTGEIMPPFTSWSSGNIWLWRNNQKTTSQDILTMEITEEEKLLAKEYEKWLTKKNDT